jgi:hypothetical protein
LRLARGFEEMDEKDRTERKRKLGIWRYGDMGKEERLERTESSA